MAVSTVFGVAALLCLAALAAVLLGWARQAKVWQLTALTALMLVLFLGTHPATRPTAAPSPAAPAPASTATPNVTKDVPQVQVLEPSPQLAPVPASTVPAEIDAHCRQVAGFGGTHSYALERSCRQQEAAAKRSVDATPAPPEVTAHCRQVAGFGGTFSWGLMQSCITQEMAARGQIVR